MAVAERRAHAVWTGDLMSGSGRLSLESSGLLKDTPVTWASRSETSDGRTSPEELLAAAHATCFAMAFSAELARAKTPPEQLDVTAVCTFDRKPEGGFAVTAMQLTVRGRVPNISEVDFQKIAEAAKEGCPISGALKGNVAISLNATLEK